MGVIRDFVKKKRAAKAKQHYDSKGTPSMGRQDLEAAKAKIRKTQEERGLKGSSKPDKPHKPKPEKNPRKERIIKGGKSNKAPAIVGIFKKRGRR